MIELETDRVSAFKGARIRLALRKDPWLDVEALVERFGIGLISATAFRARTLRALRREGLLKEDSAPDREIGSLRFALDKAILKHNIDKGLWP